MLEVILSEDDMVEIRRPQGRFQPYQPKNAQLYREQERRQARRAQFKTIDITTLTGVGSDGARNAQLIQNATFRGKDGNSYPVGYFYGRDNQYHEPGEFFGRDKQYHKEGAFIGKDGEYHPSGSFLGIDKKYHLPGTFLGTDGSYHVVGTVRKPDGSYEMRGGIDPLSGQYVSKDQQLNLADIEANDAVVGTKFNQT